MREREEMYIYLPDMDVTLAEHPKLTLTKYKATEVSKVPFSLILVLFHELCLK